MMGRLISALLVFTLATSIGSANEVHNRLQALSDDARNSMLAKLLVRSGENCHAVTRNFYQGSDTTGAAFWNAACSDGSAYVIMVYNDETGSTRILDCSLVEKIGGTACFTKF